MATRRARKRRIVVRIDMAIGASRAVVGNPEEIVSKGCTQPRGRRMACCTRSWVTGGDVIGNRPAQRCRALPLSGVATVTIHWRRSGTGVAKIAGDCGVRAGQWKGRCVVIKGRTQP